MHADLKPRIQGLQRIAKDSILQDLCPKSMGDCDYLLLIINLVTQELFNKDRYGVIVYEEEAVYNIRNIDGFYWCRSLNKKI